jgi:hypothetical protein
MKITFELTEADLIEILGGYVKPEAIKRLANDPALAEFAAEASAAFFKSEMKDLDDYIDRGLLTSTDLEEG